MQNREMFLSHGGEAFDYAPCLNASPAHVALYAGLFERHVQGWPGLDGRDDPSEREAARQRALSLGASA